MPNLKELAKQNAKPLAPGHRLCPGCMAPTVVRQVLLSSKYPVVVVCATGCLEVSTTIYPYTSWNVPYLHNAFENAASTLSGIETAYRHFKKTGKYDKELRFVAFGGDGGTYDIGLQALSGAMERRHNLLYVCYDNEGYMNTGAQRSGATPLGANTTTAPVGKVIKGKTEQRKDLTMIMAAHDVPYVAQASPSKPLDLMKKAEKAFEYGGPTFINTLSTCVRSWVVDTKHAVDVLKAAVETRFWPLYEVDHGVFKVTYKPKEKLPIEEFLKYQGRYRDMLKPDAKDLVKMLQDWVDYKWEQLLALEAATLPKQPVDAEFIG